MNTRKECINIVRKILSPNNHDINRISFAEGGQLDYLSSIDINTGVINFPMLQEVFLILYELDEGKRILYLFLAISLIENDEYDSCEEVLEILEHKGLPVCQDPKALYTSILVKQLFIILHECGHFYNETDEEWNKKLCEQNVKSLENASFEDIDESIMEKVISEERKLNPQFSISDLENVLRNRQTLMSEYNSEKTFVEESNADLFALEALEYYLKEDREFMSADKTRISILEGICSIHSIHFLKNLLTLYADDEDEDATEIISPLFQYRYGMLGTRINEMFNGAYLDFIDIFYKYITKPLFDQDYVADEKEYDFELYDYIEDAFGSNCKMTNLTQKNRLYKRIMEYADSIMGLYKTR